MAITNASRLADFGSGIGTGGAVLEVDNANKRIGLGTTNPNTTVQVGAVGASGTSMFVHGDARITGVITADQFSGVVKGVGVPGVSTSGHSIFNTINASGIVTASEFSGDGSNLTGVSGFGTALSSTQGSLGNLIYKTPRSYTITAGTSERITSDQTSGQVAFTRLGEIRVGSASTFTVGSGTTLIMDVLSIFP